MSNAVSDFMAVRPTNTAEPEQIEAGAARTDAPRGVYVSKESLTFPLASGVVIALLTVANVVDPGASDNLAWMLGMSAFVGVVIYLLSITSTMSTWDKFTGALIAIINTAILFGAVLGVLSVGNPPSDEPEESPAAWVSG